MPWTQQTVKPLVSVESDGATRCSFPDKDPEDHVTLLCSDVCVETYERTFVLTLYGGMAPCMSCTPTLLYVS